MAQDVEQDVSGDQRSRPCPSSIPSGTGEPPIHVLRLQIAGQVVGAADSVTRSVPRCDSCEEAQSSAADEGKPTEPPDAAADSRAPESAEPVESKIVSQISPRKEGSQTRVGIERASLNMFAKTSDGD